LLTSPAARATAHDHDCPAHAHLRSRT